MSALLGAAIIGALGVVVGIVHAVWAGDDPDAW